jgi:hypothetical protein
MIPLGIATDGIRSAFPRLLSKFNPQPFSEVVNRFQNSLFVLKPPAFNEQKSIEQLLLLQTFVDVARRVISELPGWRIRYDLAFELGVTPHREPKQMHDLLVELCSVRLAYTLPDRVCLACKPIGITAEHGLFELFAKYVPASLAFPLNAEYGFDSHHRHFLKRDFAREIRLNERFSDCERSRTEAHENTIQRKA